MINYCTNLSHTMSLLFCSTAGSPNSNHLLANDRDEAGKATHIMGIAQQTESRLEDESLKSVDCTVTDDQQSDEPLSFESRKTKE